MSNMDVRVSYEVYPIGTSREMWKNGYSIACFCANVLVIGVLYFSGTHLNNTSTYITCTGCISGIHNSNEK